MSINSSGRPVLDRATILPDRNRQPGSEDKIVAGIFAAVMERRLPPGTKLPERAVCEAFGVSRARIRRTLLMLAEREIVELRSNRGAFIACPSPNEARDVFEARRTIEATVVRNAVQRITHVKVSALRDHVEMEIAAGTAGNRHEAIRLSGQFHVKLAQFANNPVFVRFVEELVARTSLIIGLFGSPRIFVLFGRRTSRANRSYLETGCRAGHEADDVSP